MSTNKKKISLASKRSPDSTQSKCKANFPEGKYGPLVLESTQARGQVLSALGLVGCRFNTNWILASLFGTPYLGDLITYWLLGCPLCSLLLPFHVSCVKFRDLHDFKYVGH